MLRTLKTYRVYAVYSTGVDAVLRRVALYRHDEFSDATAHATRVPNGFVLAEKHANPNYNAKPERVTLAPVTLPKPRAYKGRAAKN